MKRRTPNPFPGVTRVSDRHGKVRWRFRMKGRPPCYLPGEYASSEFRAAYERALNGEGEEGPPPSRAAVHGSFDWLIEHYLRTPDWQKLAKITKKNLGNDIDRFRRAHGTKMVADLQPHHVEAILARQAGTPAAANKLLKLIRRLCNQAIRRGVITVNPAQNVKGYGTNPDGYHTWTDDEIERFEAHHGKASLAVLALRLMLYTGAARQDVAALGWQNVRRDRIAYRRKKTGGDVDLPIHPDLAAALANVPRDQMLFVTWAEGKPYSAETFGNWFRTRCVAAGLPHCSAHGLRKAGATRLANAGANEFEVMAFLGHRTPDEARTYVKKFSRARLGDSGMEKLLGVSNPVERLDKHRTKVLKVKEE